MEYLQIAVRCSGSFIDWPQSSAVSVSKPELSKPPAALANPD